MSLPEIEARIQQELEQKIKKDFEEKERQLQEEHHRKLEHEKQEKEEQLRSGYTQSYPVLSSSLVVVILYKNREVYIFYTFYITIPYNIIHSIYSSQICFVSVLLYMYNLHILQ